MTMIYLFMVGSIFWTIFRGGLDDGDPVGVNLFISAVATFLIVLTLYTIANGIDFLNHNITITVTEHKG